MSDTSNRVVPGKDLPEKNTSFPRKTVWALIGLPIGLVAGGLLGGGLYSFLRLLDPSMSRISYLLGIATVYVVFKGTQRWLITIGAVRHYNRLAEQDPSKLLDAYVQAGLWWMDKGDVKNAITYFDKALDQSPTYRDAIIASAAALMKSGKTQKAIDLLEPWLAKNDDFMGEVIAAEAFKKRHDHQASVRHFHRCLELFPGTPKRADIERYISEYGSQPRVEQRAYAVVNSSKEIIEISNEQPVLLFADSNSPGFLGYFEKKILPSIEFVANNSGVQIAYSNIGVTSELGNYLKGMKMKANGCILFKNGQVVKNKKLEFLVKDMPSGYIKAAKGVLE